MNEYYKDVSQRLKPIEKNPVPLTPENLRFLKEILRRTHPDKNKDVQAKQLYLRANSILSTSKDAAGYADQRKQKQYLEKQLMDGIPRNPYDPSLQEKLKAYHGLLDRVFLTSQQKLSIAKDYHLFLLFLLKAQFDVDKQNRQYRQCLDKAKLIAGQLFLQKDYLQIDFDFLQKDFVPMMSDKDLLRMKETQDFLSTMLALYVEKFNKRFKIQGKRDYYVQLLLKSFGEVNIHLPSTIPQSTSAAPSTIPQSTSAAPSTIPRSPPPSTIPLYRRPKIVPKTVSDNLFTKAVNLADLRERKFSPWWVHLVRALIPDFRQSALRKYIKTNKSGGINKQKVQELFFQGLPPRNNTHACKNQIKIFLQNSQIPASQLQSSFTTSQSCKDPEKL